MEASRKMDSPMNSEVKINKQIKENPEDKWSVEDKWSAEKNGSNMGSRVHRVGTVTFGLVLIVFGILFLARLFYPAMSYVMIFHLWPCILIILGIEILLANRQNGVRFVYDKTAIFLTLVLVCFAMCMGGIDYCIEHANNYIYIG